MRKEQVYTRWPGIYIHGFMNEEATTGVKGYSVLPLDS